MPATGQAFDTANSEEQGRPEAGNGPPTSSRITGGLAVLACAACCAVPLLIVAGLLSGAGAALLQQTLIALAVGLAAIALGTWWLHRRRHRTAGAAAGHRCGDHGCAC